jgi:O-antigen ligase
MLSVIFATLAAVMPLALLFGVFVSHDVIPKLILLCCSAGALLVLMPKWFSGIIVLSRRKDGRAFLFAALAQFISLLVSWVFSPAPLLSLAGTTWRRYGVAEQTAILVIAVSASAITAARPVWAKFLLRAIGAGAVAASIYGISQYFGFDPFLPRNLYTISYLGGIVRPPGTMGHAIYFSAYLAPVIVISTWAANNEDSAQWRRIFGAAAMLGALAILLSGTRSGLLAAAAGIVVLGVRAVMGSGFRATGTLKWASAFFCGMLVLVWSPPGADLRHRITQWTEDPGGPRVGVWTDSLQIVGQFPVQGAGPETFAAAFRRVESANLSRQYPDFLHETPHNAFLDSVIAQGVPGLAVLLFLPWLGIRDLRVCSSPRAALGAAILAMAVNFLFVSPVLVTGMFFWLVSALRAGLSDLEAARQRDEYPATAPSRFLRGAGWAGAVFLVALAIILAVPDALCAAIEKAVALHDSGRAQEVAGDVNSWSFGLPGYQLWISRQMATLGVAIGAHPADGGPWKSAAEASALAERTSEEPFSALYQSSVLAVASTDLARGEATAREAIVAAPNWYKPHLLRAQILEAEGRREESLAEARASIYLGYRGH